MIFVVYGLHYGITKIRRRAAPNFDRYIGATVEVLLLGYSTLVRVSFQLLGCVQVNSEKRLFLDGNVVCFQWWQHLIVAFVAIFVVPFVVVLGWGSLKFYKKTISAKTFLLSCALPLPFLSYWTFLYLCRCHKAASFENNRQQDCKFLQKVLFEPFRARPDDRPTVSWEIVLIGRRFVLTAVHTAAPDPLTRLLSLSFLCVLFLLHHNISRPFLGLFKSVDNRDKSMNEIKDTKRMT